MQPTMYQDVHEKLSLLKGKILMLEESEIHRDLYLLAGEIKEMLTQDPSEVGDYYCPLCGYLVDPEEEEEETDDWELKGERKANGW